MVFPVSEQASWRPVERDAVALDFVPAVIGVKAEAAPVVVGIVGVGGEFEEDGCWFGGVGRFAEDEVAGRVLGLRCAEGDVIISGFPICGDGNTDRRGPVAAMRRGVFGSRMGGADDVVLFPNGDPLGAETGEFGGKFWGGAGDMKRDAFAGGVADTACVAFDRCCGERDWQKENCEEDGSFHGALLEA